MAPELRERARVSSPTPARAGVGLKPEHYWDITETMPDIGWFEVHPENYMGAGGYPHHMLARVRESYPLSLHGVGLSIGAAGPLDLDHLARLKSLIKRYEPGLVSEHLAWSTHDGSFLSDLLPIPYTVETLDHVVRHVDQVQSALGRQVLIENPSTYVLFEESSFSETEFLDLLACRSGCGLLLDCNNAFVSAINHRQNPTAYIDTFPMRHVREFHLAGHAEVDDEDGGRLLIDAHDSSVIDEVWSLYERALARSGPISTLIEWDNDIPPWQELFEEAQKAERLLDSATRSPDACAA